MRRLVRRFSMPRQWLLAYLLLIVVPAAVFLYGYYERSASILRGEVIRTMQQALKQAGSNLSYRLEHIEDVSNAAFMNPKLQSYLSVRADDQSVAIQMDVIKELRYLVDTVQSNTDVYRVRLFVGKSKIYAAERINFFSLDALKDRPWYSPIIAANGGIVWTSDYLETYLDTGNLNVFSAARMLRDPDHYDQVSGVLMIDVQEKRVADILSTLQFASGTQVYLVDANGQIVYHPDRARIGSIVDPAVQELLRQGEEGSGSLKLNDVANDVMFTTLHPTGWKLVAQGTESQLSQRAVRLTQRSELTSLLEYVALFLVLPFVLLAIIVRGMNRRVNQVITVIRREGTEGLQELPANGDFHMLERSVDHLVLRVRTLVEEKYKAQLHEREAQLQALQAQINPHFLYNTLDTINWIAIGRGASDISQMIDSLAKYFRLSLNKGKTVVSVEDEVRLAEVYLEIQQSRFPNTFEFRVDIEPGLEACRMPKLILQPIVENALLHGIRKSKHKRGVIAIAVRRDQGDLLLTVSDDGIGMEEELARRLLTAAPHSEGGEGGGWGGGRGDNGGSGGGNGSRGGHGGGSGARGSGGGSAGRGDHGSGRGSGGRGDNGGGNGRSNGGSGNGIVGGNAGRGENGGGTGRSGGGSGSSYGLYNVNERIKLYAGEAYGLSIDSRPGAGTTIAVRLRANLAAEADPGGEDG